MLSFIISLKDNKISQDATKILKKSLNEHSCMFAENIFEAITPENAYSTLTDLRLTWTFPTVKAQNETVIIDGVTLKLKAYETTDQRKRIACALSHFLLWDLCSRIDNPVMILEHDALFIRSFEMIEDYLPEKKTYADLEMIIGLNSPMKATRKASIYDKKVSDAYILKQRKNKEGFIEILPCPYVDDDLEVPQGLAGNSAYIIFPAAAKRLVNLVRIHGLWPNDAIMCNQLMSGMLYQTFPYFTRVQGTESTTSK